MPQLPCASVRSLALLQLLRSSHYLSSSRFLKHFPVDLFWKSWYGLTMPSIPPKKIGGPAYYYARYCQRVDGKPKIVRQVYLGKIDDLVAAAEHSRQPAQPPRNGGG